MILLGDSNIPCEKIEKIDTIDDIKNSPSNSTILFKFNMEILKYTNNNNINSAVLVENIKEVMYSSLLKAKYIIPNDCILEDAQKIAENYIFDSKILAKINSSSEIEKIALMQIDGAIIF